jgi:hypothetical protein
MNRAPWLATFLAVVVSVGLDAQVASQAQLPPQPGALTPEAEAALPLRIESITPNVYYTNLISMCCNFAFDHRPIQTWIASYKVLEALDFDRVFTNHGQVGDKASLVAFRQYLEEIYAAVSEGIKAGRTVEELQRTVLLEKQKDRLGYEQQRAAVIQSAYDSLTKYSR